MYTPHTVTVYNVTGEETLITLLRGVYLEPSSGISLDKSGAASDSNAALFIPFSCEAVSAVTGQAQRYVTPKQFDRLEDRATVWTIGPRDRSSGADCFFVKGEVAEPEMEYEEIREAYDFVYRVRRVDTNDFGSADMRHWEVEGV